MTGDVSTAALRVLPNPRLDRSRSYGAAERAILDLERHTRARAEISSWPGYEPTPLLDLPALAADTGIAGLWVKDEGGRFGLGSFKALGGAYAVLLLLARAVRDATGATATAAELAAGEHADIVGSFVVTCATDGNHGRAVAWGARTFGCRSVVYLHEHVSGGREAAIAAYGAEIVRVRGNYDDSVQAAQRDAERHGRFVISDTAYPGCEDVPRDVMQGYTLIAAEVLEQLSADAPPTHILVQAGVGGLAAAWTAHLWQTLGAERPRIVLIEPARAACLVASAEAGHVTQLTGDIDTVMACLSCAAPSTLAWRILDRGADAFVAIPDAAAVSAMRRLARPTRGDPAVIAGESGAAGVGALLALAEDDEARARLDLGTGARVLCIITEGATDPEIWHRLVRSD